MKSLKYPIILFGLLSSGLLILPGSQAVETTIYEYDSLYHNIKVFQDGDQRSLAFDTNYYQTKVDITDPMSGHYHYVDLLFESLLFKSDPESICVLGLGGGSAPRLIKNYFPEMELLTVELDPAVVDVAEEYFFYDSETYPTEIEDARRFLRTTDKTFDIIMQDSYTSNAYGTYVPFHLATYEYFTLVYEKLNDDGVLAINVIGTVYGGEPNRVITVIYRTLHEVFPNLYMFAADDAQNVVIIASKDETRMSKIEMLTVAQRLYKEQRGSLPLGWISNCNNLYDTAPSGLAGANVLTDDYAPTDNLLR